MKAKNRNSDDSESSFPIDQIFLPVYILVLMAVCAAMAAPPAVIIDSPRNFSEFNAGEEIKFSGRASDSADVTLNGRKLVWKSDISGTIGFGETFSTSKLAVGTHLITLSATNSKNITSRADILISVMKPGTAKKAESQDTMPAKVDEPKPAEKKAAAPAAEPQKKIEKIWGICYSPFRENQNPEAGIYPSAEEMAQDIALVAKNASAMRTYGSVNTPGIPDMCEKAGIDCYPGAWIGKDRADNLKEIAGLRKISGQNLSRVKGLIVGNEVLLREDLTKAELVELIRSVKSSTALPVSTAEICQKWIENKSLGDEVDFIVVHIHPYWEGIECDKAAQRVVNVWKYMKEQFPGKRVVIGETGWPSGGKKKGSAVPSPENQARFFSDFTKLAKQEGIEYFWFDMFDEKWKAAQEGEVGAHWGVYNQDGSLKPAFKQLLPVQDSITRPPAKVSPVAVKAPVYVYTDADAMNAFEPSGYMGDLDCIDVDKACEDNPYSGKTCTRVVYNPAAGSHQRWSGVYWQFPVNNWGDYPGYKISGAGKLTFWARGHKGGEKAEFKSGGISNSGKTHRDSFGPMSTGVIVLASKWKKYSIDLKGCDTGSVIGGFCWVTNTAQNPGGCVIYVDDIVFEPKESEALQQPEIPAMKDEPENSGEPATQNAQSTERSAIKAAFAKPDRIPFLTFADGNPWKTDLGSNFGLLLGPDWSVPKRDSLKPKVAQRLLFENGARSIRIEYSNLRKPHQFAGIWASVFGHIDDKVVMPPKKVFSGITGIRFSARSGFASNVSLKLEVKDGKGTALIERRLTVTPNWVEFLIDVSEFPERMKEIDFVVESRFQDSEEELVSGVLDMRDFSLSCDGGVPFKIPGDDAELLGWLKGSCLNYFVWNYRDAGDGKGFVLERNSFHDFVSISGMGFAFPAIIAAEMEGIIDKQTARDRTLAMLKWIFYLDCKDGKSGLHGFPYHFLKPDGTRAGDSEVSTVDWAICAAGIRVARAHYIHDTAIRRVSSMILGRPEWKSVVTKNGMISHGFGKDGGLLEAEWGSSFTEEAYLTALEAVASGDVGPDVFGKIRRDEKSGFWPSWFGSGFTYNWLQLWTGPFEPLATNSMKAYDADRVFCMLRHGKNIVGMTSCETFSGVDESGFLKWDTYLGENGSDVHLGELSSVSHKSICPYGAALALPFIKGKAVYSLRVYAGLCSPNPILGFPDSLRMEEMPAGWSAPVPNWTQFAIDVGSMLLSIENSEGPGFVAKLYTKDINIADALSKLKASLDR